MQINPRRRGANDLMRPVPSIRPGLDSNEPGITQRVNIAFNCTAVTIQPSSQATATVV